MYKNIPYQHKKSACDRLIRCNFVIIAVLTVSSTALTAYLLNVIVYYEPSAVTNNVSVAKTEAEASYPNAKSAQSTNTDVDWDGDQKATIMKNQSLGMSRDWNPLLEASEAIESKMMPEAIPLTIDMEKFKQRLATMTKHELLELLKVLQERIDGSAVAERKRNIADKHSMEQTRIQHQFKEKEAVVHRSEKMSQLMDYLDRLQLNMPQININRLDGLSSMSGDAKSLVKIVKPSIMNAVLKPPDQSMQSSLEREVRAVDNSWQERIESVAPSEGWPQQPEVVVEDWPVEPQTTARPKKKKRKKKVPTTTTTSTTTTTPPPPETTYVPPSSPAPPTAFEEVWIEEEEDIYRPPRRKLKKYKKKPLTTTTTTTTSTSTTTTTTSTTPAPTTTTTEAPVEDWPKDHWAAKSSTSSPATGWPNEPAQEEKWPEEEWLNTVKNTVQNQLNLIYV